MTTGVVGFGNPNDEGRWEGLDIDTCRAVASAVFGDKDKVTFVPTTSSERFTVLQSGEVDMLARNTTWTFSRDVNLGFEFVGVNYYDGQAKPSPLLMRFKYTSSKASCCRPAAQPWVMAA